eukprot:UN11884
MSKPEPLQDNNSFANHANVHVDLKAPPNDLKPPPDLETDDDLEPPKMPQGEPSMDDLNNASPHVGPIEYTSKPKSGNNNLKPNGEPINTSYSRDGSASTTSMNCDT